MSRNFDASIGYGFGILNSEGTPEELEGFIDDFSDSYGIPDALSLCFWGYSDMWTPVIAVRRTVVDTYFGEPTQIQMSEITDDEIHALVETRSKMLALIQGGEGYDEAWDARVGHIGWLFWAHFA